jgi:hypothetical protein
MGDGVEIAPPHRGKATPHTRAGGRACPSAERQPHTRVMASSPMRKLRKTGAVDPDGNVVTIPRLPSVTGTHKRPGWNRWSAAEKVEHLLGLSLDRMHDYLSWPADGLDPYRLAAQAQVIRVVAVVAAKVGVEARRERDRDRVLEKLSLELRTRLRERTAPET